MRIYLPQKVIFTEAATVNKFLCLPKLKSITVNLYHFSTVNEKFLLSLLLLACSTQATVFILNILM